MDHSTRTLDGKNTFHGMGIIASVAPSITTPGPAVKRSLKRKNMKDITSSKGVPILEYFGKAIPASALWFKQQKI